MSKTHPEHLQNTPSTIFALATPAGKSGVAIIRLSGAMSNHVLTRLAGKPVPPRRAVRVSLRDPASEALLDEALALFFKAPASFTGEDVAELHVHGSLAVIDAVLAVLAREKHLRPAEAGEFAKRAFLNGKMDLTQAEGLGDLIEAQTQTQRVLALRQAGGHLRELCEVWLEELLACRAQIEATLDFPEEEDVPQRNKGLATAINRLTLAMRQQTEAPPAGEILRRGAMAVLLGAPNIGKSSLFNRLARREAALTSPISGTTRDILPLPLNLGGYAVLLHDSAGLDEDAGELAVMARAKTLETSQTADIRILVRTPEGDFQPAPTKGDILVCNKADLVPPSKNNRKNSEELWVSAKTGAGLECLTAALAARAKELCRPAELAPVMTHARHLSALRRSQAALGAAAAVLSEGGATELAGEELRRAGEALGEITGATNIEAVLDLVFSRFCIGK